MWRICGGKWLCCTMTSAAEADAANYNQPFRNYTVLRIPPQHSYPLRQAIRSNPPDSDQRLLSLWDRRSFHYNRCRLQTDLCPLARHLLHPLRPYKPDLIWIWIPDAAKHTPIQNPHTPPQPWPKPKPQSTSRNSSPSPSSASSPSAGTSTNLQAPPLPEAAAVPAPRATALSTPPKSRKSAPCSRSSTAAA